jgi:hypothetical protein
MRKRRVTKIPKPFSEMTVVERIKEARAAIERLEAQQQANWRSPNRSHEMGVNLDAALSRWRKTLALLQGENK